MNSVEILFSLRGRIGRAAYWIAIVPLLLTGLLGWLLSGLGNTEAALLGNVLGLSVVWPLLAVNVKRWHDRDKSGWWILIGIVPVIGQVWTVIECGLLPGTNGYNGYGEPPPRILLPRTSGADRPEAERAKTPIEAADEAAERVSAELASLMKMAGLMIRSDAEAQADKYEVVREHLSREMGLDEDRVKDAVTIALGARFSRDSFEANAEVVKAAHEADEEPTEEEKGKDESSSGVPETAAEEGPAAEDGPVVEHGAKAEGGVMTEDGGKAEGGIRRGDTAGAEGGEESETGPQGRQAEYARQYETQFETQFESGPAEADEATPELDTAGLNTVSDFLFKLAMVDETISESEEILLAQLYGVFGFRGSAHSSHRYVHGSWQGGMASHIPVANRHKYYAEALGIEGTVTPEAVRTAYRKLVKQYHPDKVSHLGPKLKEAADVEIKKINEAYAYFSKKLDM